MNIYMGMALIYPVDAIILFFYYINLMKLRFENKISQLGLFLSLLVMTEIGVIFYKNMLLKALYAIICMMIIISIFFIDKVWWKIFVVATYYICSGIGELLSIVIINMFNNDLYSDIQQGIISWNFLKASLIAYIIIISSVLIMIKKFRKNKFRIEGELYISIYCVMQIISVAILTAFIRKYSPNATTFIIYIVISTIIIGIYTLLIINNAKNEANSKARALHAEEILLMQYQYMADIKQQYNLVRELKHNYRGYMEIIDGLTKNKLYQELEKFVNEFGEVHTKLDGITFCDRYTLDIVLHNKYEHAKANEIPINIVIENIEEIKIPDFDLCTIASNLLQNAIEGCLSIKAEKRNVDFLIRRKANFVVFHMCNSCNKPQESFRTTKENELEHGLGLNIIRNIAKKHGGDTLFEYQNGQFLSTVTLKFE